MAEKRSLINSDEIQIIVLDNGRELEFPADMSDESIAAAIKTLDSPSSPEGKTFGQQFLGRAKEIGQGALRLGQTAIGLQEPSTKTGRLLGRVLPTAGALGDIGQGVVESQIRQLRQAVPKEISETEPLSQERLLAAAEGTGRLAAGLLPGVGPVAAGFGEQIGERNIGAAAADAALLLSTYGLPAATGALKKGIRRLRPLKTTPEVARETFLSVKPKANVRVAINRDLPRVLQEDVLPRLKGRKIESLGDFQSILQKGLDDVGAQIDAVLARHPNITINGDAMAKAIRDSLDDIAKRLDSTAVEKAGELAKSFEGRKLSLTEAEGWRQTMNNRLSFFFKKNNVSQREAAGGSVEVKHELALRDSIATEIDRALNQFGENLSPIRQRYGRLRGLTDATNERIIAELIKENPKLLEFSSLDTMLLGGTVGAGLFGAPPEAVLLGLTTVGIRRAMVILNAIRKRPDSRIRRAFKQFQQESPTTGNIAKASKILAPLLLLEEVQEPKKKSLGRVELTIP